MNVAFEIPAATESARSAASDRGCRTFSADSLRLRRRTILTRRSFGLKIAKVLVIQYLESL
jgi:hypothetical protein